MNPTKEIQTIWSKTDITERRKVRHFGTSSSIIKEPQTGKQQGYKSKLTPISSLEDWVIDGSVTHQGKSTTFWIWYASENFQICK